MGPLSGMRVLVSGAGVAGPALAHWLAHYGASTTVVEVARQLRGSGFAVDFRGPTHLGVLADMGVLDDLRAVRTGAGAMRFVDEHGAEVFTLPAEFAGGDLEVHRGDLARVFHQHTADRVDYRFGDTITELTDTPDAVVVDFAHAERAEFDLVIGADGMHSTVRRLAFGPEAEHVRHLGYYLAGWSLPDDLGAEPGTQVLYNEPGRMAAISADPRTPGTATAQVAFASELLHYDWHDTAQHKKLVHDALLGMRWHTPRLLDSLAEVDDLYFDAICRVRAPQWWRGRVALLGDAAFGVTLGGMGVGASVVGARVLAGELAVAGGEHTGAFAAYERRLRPYAARWQRGTNAGRFLAPASRAGLALRNRTLSSARVRRMMINATQSMANAVDLPDYPR